MGEGVVNGGGAGEGRVNGGGVRQWGRGHQWGRDYLLNDRETQSKFDANMFEAPVE